MTLLEQFAEAARPWPDPVRAFAAGAESEDAQVAWVLLASALQQNIALQPLLQFLQRLKEAMGGFEALSALPAPSEQLLTDLVKKNFQEEAWELGEHVPGIVWSVGRFARERQGTGGLARWLRSVSAQEAWEAVSQIHFMGKNSKERRKALLFLARMQKPGLPLPPTDGARRWLAWQGRASNKSSDYATLYRRSSFHSMQFFAEPWLFSYLCRIHLKGCEKCPLKNDCKRCA
jgi:hypothetical protein